MTTLIEVRNSSGVVGRCDAKCYNAKHPECDCICRGKNHGAGYQQAVENTRDLAEKWIKRYVEENGLSKEDTEALLGADIVQSGLFEGGAS